MTCPAVRLSSFGVLLGDRVVLSDVSFELASVGMTVLVGPAGGGKSTLLRTLCGLNDAHPSIQTWGSVSFGGDSASFGADLVRSTQVPALVLQNARFFLDTVRENLVSALPNRSELERFEQIELVRAQLEAIGLGELTSDLERNALELPLPLQRKLAIARALLCDPGALFADEPTVGLEESDAFDVIALLRHQAERRAVLLVTHNQRLALACGGTTLLLAGGRIEEASPTAEFFSSPRTELGRTFLRTGSCVATAPEKALERSSSAVARVPEIAGIRNFVWPRSFFWVLPGRLGGLPRPGIIDSLEKDLEGLRALQVSILVTLEESRTVREDLLAELSIQSVHFPVPDMGAPEIEAALDLCERVGKWIEAGEVVALHCRAGLGRTGTLLACQLIWSGEKPGSALQRVRSINPRCVQSECQVEFLREFGAALMNRKFDADDRST